MNNLPTGLTLAEVKEHLRVMHPDDDWLIQRYIDAAFIEIQAKAEVAFTIEQLPADLAFAVMEQVAFAFDNRGDQDAARGLVPAAARICARYRGVAL